VTTQITWDFSSEVKDTTLAICKGRMSILVRLFVHHPLLKFQSHLRFQRSFKRLDILNIFKWCPGAESNHRHEDFQKTASPKSHCLCDCQRRRSNCAKERAKQSTLENTIPNLKVLFEQISFGFRLLQLST